MLNARAEDAQSLAWWGIDLADAPGVLEDFGVIALVGLGFIAVQSLLLTLSGNTTNIKLRARAEEFGGALGDYGNRIMAQLRARRSAIDARATQSGKISALMYAHQTTIEGISYFNRLDFLSAPSQGDQHILRNFIEQLFPKSTGGNFGPGFAIGLAVGLVFGLAATGQAIDVSTLPALAELEKYPFLANWTILPALVFLFVGLFVWTITPIFEKLMSEPIYRTALQSIKAGYSEKQAPFPARHRGIYGNAHRHRWHLWQCRA